MYIKLIYTNKFQQAKKIKKQNFFLHVKLVEYLKKQ